MRTDRDANSLRPIKIEPGYAAHTASVIFHMGNTIVNCTASLSNQPPSFVDEGTGWITAEYAMLPGSTSHRVSRDRGRKISGRTMEIQRLIGRSLRGIADLSALGPRSIQIDCDILNADGGTRCASITAAYIVLAQTLNKLEAEGELTTSKVLRSEVAAVSLGLIDGQLLLDLQYTEDYLADVDLNLIMTGDGSIIEVQGTAEGKPFSRDNLNAMMDLGTQGIEELVRRQREYLEAHPTPSRR
ncbi:MAG: ribonuclease PH [Deltaproteobacteria bacterium]|nr:MAG: ribonuclease PH [Deltaproteobacteria bacterium]